MRNYLHIHIMTQRYKCAKEYREMRKKPSSILLQRETYGIDTIAFSTAAFWTIFKYVPKMRAALFAKHFCSLHTLARVFRKSDMLRIRRLGE